MRGQSWLAALLVGGSLLSGFAGYVILAGPGDEGSVSGLTDQQAGPGLAGIKADRRLPMSGGHTGTAFSVAPGTMVTNAHVVLRCRADGRPLQVAGWAGFLQVAYEENAADLALLSSGQPDFSGAVVLPVSGAVQLGRGTPVLVSGYPARAVASGHGAELQQREGQVLRAALTVHQPQGQQATSFFMTDRQGREMEPSWENGISYFGAQNAGRMRWLIEIDAPTEPGGSGGPVLDGAGNVVGVVFAGSGQRGVTSAVPLSDLLEFLSRAGVQPVVQPPGPTRGQVDWSRVKSRAARGVHRVFC